MPRDRERQTLLQQLQSETAIQQGVQTQEEVTSGEVSEHTPESDPGQEMIHKVYLTFDDGPSIYTDEILDILDRYHVKATFFVVGKDGSEAEAALQRIVEDGHTLECILISTSIKNSMNRWIVSQKISHGSETTSTRRPVWKASIIVFLGAAPIRSAILICMNLLIIWTVRAWNILTGMCPPEMAEAVICLSIPCWKNCTEDIDTRDTSIILLHDSAEKPTTVEALPDIIENILARPDTVILPITENTRPVHHVE